MIALAVAAACGEAKNESGSETGGDSSSGGSSSSGGGSGSTTGMEVPEPTSSGGSITSTGGASSGVETMTSGEEPPVGPCEAFCEHAIACMTEDPAACLSDCAAQLDAFEGDCQVASQAAIACMTGMTCEELVSLGEGDPGPCQGPLDKQTSCAEGCSVGGGGDVEGTSCEWMRECPLEPSLKMVCDAETCECFEDEQLVGSCPTEGACLDIATLADKANACCGIPGSE